MSKFCPECGTQMENIAKFCVKCGAKLSDYISDNGMKDNFIQRSQIGGTANPNITIINGARVPKDSSSNNPFGKECKSCKGTGKIRCTRCDGRGKYYDPGDIFNFPLSTKCTRCNESGKVKCEQCGGTGYIKFT